MDEKCILDPQRDCLGLAKANMLEKQMSEWREASRSTHKELFDRMRELEKAEAAREAGCALLVVERPSRETGLTLEEIQKKLMEEENA